MSTNDMHLRESIQRIERGVGKARHARERLRRARERVPQNRGSRVRAPASSSLREGADHAPRFEHVADQVSGPKAVRLSRIAGLPRPWFGKRSGFVKLPASPFSAM